MPTHASARSRTTVKVWDTPLRLFHGLLALCTIGAFITVWVGGLWMDWHVRFGQAIFVLLIFRLIWGFIGPHNARFRSFVRGPKVITAYLKGNLGATGHNPLGALSVLAMLLALGVQVGTGLFATDGIFTEGPLAASVSVSTSDTLTWIHQLNEPILLTLLGLHLVAIAWYTGVRRQPLIKAMVTGNKPAGILPERTPAEQDDWRIWLRAVVVLALALALWFVLIR